MGERVTPTPVAFTVDAYESQGSWYGQVHLGSHWRILTTNACHDRDVAVLEAQEVLAETLIRLAQPVANERPERTQPPLMPAAPACSECRQLTDELEWSRQ